MTPEARMLGSLAILLALVLIACTQSGQQTFDQQFIDMMVPHHQGALEMATIAQSRSQRPEIKQLATSILASQKTEIDQMKQWRKVWYGSDQTPPMTRMPMVPGMGGEHGGHGTMNMQADVDALRRAGDPFDKAFIDMMIPHHQSGIDAAKAAEGRAQKQEIKDLAKAIIAEQQREIDQMKQWQQEWFEASASPTPVYRFSVATSTSGNQFALPTPPPLPRPTSLAPSIAPGPPSATPEGHVHE